MHHLIVCYGHPDNPESFDPEGQAAADIENFATGGATMFVTYGFIPSP
ncbi:hypothetical protein [Rhodococcus artemisiae]|uniref:Flavodoxin-like protein n=1 Tax=Rhodococcus artemisiae TaxID=714159 RepID=A0ABU7LGM7_9NOCA|nr:hypothetical protein [Rhodococcus artemisiae]MEE2060714.1 hypothetical protein [Rhodococcus artemisiae]